MNTIPRKCSRGAIWLCLILGLVTGCSDPAATAETDEILDEVKTKHLSENTFWLEQGWAGKWAPVVLFIGFGDNLDACIAVEELFTKEGGNYRCTRADQALPLYEQQE